VDAFSVSAEDMLGLEPPKGSRRMEAQQRVHGEGLLRGAEVGSCTERVRDDECSRRSPPEARLAPAGKVDDAEDLERRTRYALERRHMKGHAVARREQCGVPSVPVEQLHYAGGLAERTDASIQAVDIHRVDEPYTAAIGEGMRQALQKLWLGGDPSEAERELVAETGRGQGSLSCPCDGSSQGLQRLRRVFKAV
jgi:hypothetical protein